jgi:hypothetical protein
VPRGSRACPNTAPDAGRREHLVAGEHVEVRSRAPGRRRACARPPARRRRSTSAPWRCAISIISRAGVIVPSAFDTCGNATELVRGSEQPLVLLRGSRRRVVDRRDAQPRALLGAQHLPRNDVRVVLEVGDDDLVAARRCGGPSSARSG